MSMDVTSSAASGPTLVWPENKLRSPPDTLIALTSSVIAASYPVSLMALSSNSSGSWPATGMPRELVRTSRVCGTATTLTRL